MAKVRLDVLLVERGLAESRSKAQAIIMAGQARVNGQMVDKVAALLDADATVSVDAGPRYVSRGGEKLEGALAVFPVHTEGKTCVDVGASTGGFTDCLLQYGAAKVYAIDVGKGILHWKLRTDARVVVMEETNARFVERLPEPIQLVVCDASFISLRVLLPVMQKWLDATGEAIVLVKPQFEAGRKESAKHKGVIRDPLVHRHVLLDVLGFAMDSGFGLCGLERSPLLGPKGNVEFLAWLNVRPNLNDPVELVARIIPEI